MKLSLAVTGLLVCLVTAPCFAISLKLDPQIDLLVLDGRKISGSLLKGADSLELDRGQHQFLFRVEQQQHTALLYQSVPMIATFKADVKTITIRLPKLDNTRARHHFEHNLNFQLIDEQGKEIATLRDRLPVSAQADMEQAMITYNRARRIASVPQFASSHTAMPSGSLSADLVTAELAELPTLMLWFHRFDETLRQQILNLVKKLGTS